MHSEDRTLLSRGKKALYGILAPLVIVIGGFWLIGRTAYGEGPSAGGQSMVLLLVLLPAGLVITAVLNTCVLFMPLRSRLSAFLVGAILPAIGLVLAYNYLWHIWPFQY